VDLCSHEYGIGGNTDDANVGGGFTHLDPDSETVGLGFAWP